MTAMRQRRKRVVWLGFLLIFSLYFGCGSETGESGLDAGGSDDADVLDAGNDGDVDSDATTDADADVALDGDITPGDADVSGDEECGETVCEDGEICFDELCYESCEEEACSDTSAECVDHACVVPRCDDGIENGGETDVDCGGPDCEPCGVGEGCLENTDCLASEVGAWGACYFPGDICPEVGEQTRQVVDYFCGDGGLCEEEVSQETQECTRSTEEVACDDAELGEWGECEVDEGEFCAEEGVETRVVTTYECAGGDCVAVVDEEERSCSRETTGVSCDEPEIADWGDCYTPQGEDPCDPVGQQGRVVRTYECAVGECLSTIEVEHRECDLDTDGVSCEDGIQCTVGATCGDGMCQMGAIDEGWCRIDGTCYEEDTIKSDDDCLRCDPEYDSEGWRSRCFQDISAGDRHTCGIDLGGELQCWGNSFYGQSDPPAGIFKQVTAAFDYACAIDVNDEVQCWGYDSHGQVDPPEDAFSQIDAGQRHVCGLNTFEQVQCWGSDGHGRATPPDGSYLDVSGGWYQTCGIDSDSQVQCWGAEGLGLSTPPEGTFNKISAGRFHSCAIDDGYEIQCWGQNDDGQLNSPTGSFVELSAGQIHTCAIDTSSEIQCWGNNGNDQSTPPGGTFTEIAAGQYHACAIESLGGAVQCWGYNFSGQSSPP